MKFIHLLTDQMPLNITGLSTKGLKIDVGRGSGDSIVHVPRAKQCWFQGKRLLPRQNACPNCLLIRENFITNTSLIPSWKVSPYSYENHNWQYVCIKCSMSYYIVLHGCFATLKEHNTKEMWWYNESLRDKTNPTKCRYPNLNLFTLLSLFLNGTFWSCDNIFGTEL